MALRLGVLQRTESVMLLRQYLDPVPTSDAGLDTIAEELGDLPLALHLAGSYLKLYHRTVAPTVYVQQLCSPDLLNHPSLVGRRLRQELSPTKHEEHVVRTFVPSYSRLDAREPTDALALALLARAAYFAPGKPIPHDLLLASAMQVRARTLNRRWRSMNNDLAPIIPRHALFGQSSRPRYPRSQCGAADRRD